MSTIQQRLLIPFASLGIAGPIIFVGDVLIAGAMRPGYSALDQAISALGTGPDGWQEDIAAFILGLCLLGFVIAFCWSLVGVINRTTIAWSAIAFSIFSLVWITVSLFTSAPPTRKVHTIASLVGEIAVVAGIAIVGFGLRKTSDWKAEGRISLVVAALSLVVLVLTFATSQPKIANSVHLGGLFERVLVVVVLAWFAYISARLIQRARNSFTARPS
ncbi:MAG TPA: DUF998 domain-containing protein [Marmoricola sp.]|nr:DUF998 domain-containing protein [Marmoricola sp.]